MCLLSMELGFVPNTGVQLVPCLLLQCSSGGDRPGQRKRGGKEDGVERRWTRTPWASHVGREHHASRGTSEGPLGSEEGASLN